jgi:hypothetical protein
MNVTSLFAELIIIGCEALIWLVLLFCLFFGYDWLFNLLPKLEKLEILVAVPVLGIAYILGIIVDELCDSFIEPWTAKLRNSLREEGQLDMWDMQALIFNKSQEGSMQLNYMKSRLRILRSSIYNFGITTCFCSILLITNQNIQNKGYYFIIALLFGVALTCSTIYVYKRLTLAYWKRIKSLYKTII